MEDKLCRSVSPVLVEGMYGISCAKQRGHRGRKHSNPKVKKKWLGGINTPASWEFVDEGHMSEGEWFAYGRFGY